MLKAIALIRTSTVAQEIEEQKRDVLQMCYADGLTDEEVEIVGGKGLSAIKVDDEYKAKLQRVYDLINSNPSIKCVYCWAIDRIGRKDMILTQFRCFLVEKKVQLKIKAQGLTLLNEDGTENFSVKIQFNLYATLAEAEMENKQKRMLRGRYANRANGKYNGGQCIKYGYYVDDKGYFQVCEEEAKIIRMIYNMMMSDEKRYTLRKITAELQQRGIRMRGKLLPLRTISSIVRDTVYKGGSDGRVMPRIVSDELFDAVGKRLKENIMVAPKSSKHHYYGTKIFKCNCGYYMTPTNIVYRCTAWGNTTIGIRNKRGECRDAITLSIQYVDAALWDAAVSEYYEYLQQDIKERNVKLSEQIDILNQKIKECNNVLSRHNDKKKKIAQIYVDGIIGEVDYNKQIASVNEEAKKINERITQYKEERAKAEKLMNTPLDETEYSMISAIQSSQSLHDGNDAKMCEIVHRFIRKMTAFKIVMNKDIHTVEGLDLSKQQGFHFFIEAYSGKIYQFFYTNNYKKGNGRRLFEYDPDSNKITTSETKAILDIIRTGKVQDSKYNLPLY